VKYADDLVTQIMIDRLTEIEDVMKWKLMWKKN